MNISTRLYQHLIAPVTSKKLIAVFLGNLILGIGCAALKLSTMGNDPFTACNLALSGAFHISLGNYQLMVNLVLLIIQLIWGRKYLGLGSLVNMCLLGYVIQYAMIAIQATIGTADGHGFLYRLIYMFIALILVSLGISMYQQANLGSSPYDYLARGMTDHFHNPFFVNRVITDGILVLIIIVSVFAGILTWKTCQLGIGTIACAFFLGPFINTFDIWNKKWIQ